MTIGNFLGISDQAPLENGACNVGDTISAYAFIQNPEFLKMPRMLQAPTYRIADCRCNAQRVTSTTSRTSCSFGSVTETQLPRFVKCEQVNCFAVSKALRVVATLGD